MNQIVVYCTSADCTLWEGRTVTVETRSFAPSTCDLQLGCSYGGDMAHSDGNCSSESPQRKSTSHPNNLIRTVTTSGETHSLHEKQVNCIRSSIFLNSAFRSFGDMPKVDFRKAINTPFVPFHGLLQVFHNCWKSTCRLYIGNIYNAENEDLRSYFSKYGIVTDTWVARRPRGFGYVTFEKEEDAAFALHNGQGDRIKGDAISLEYARPRVCIRMT